MKRSTLRCVVTTFALALLGGSASAATMMANNSNKGSILVFPRIDVSPGVDTLITLVNDSATDVQVKCYYRSSEPVPTPLSSKFDTSAIKHTMDFTLTLTRNQPLTWSAATGVVLGGGRQIAQAFTNWPDGTARTRGELKCFAIGADPSGNVTQINFNQLFGTAAIVGAPFGAAGQAYEYNAWAFQALGGTLAQGQPVGNTPGVLNLDGTLNGYDMCPNILVGAFQPRGAPPIFPGRVPVVAIVEADLGAHFGGFYSGVGPAVLSIVSGAAGNPTPGVEVGVTTTGAASSAFGALLAATTAAAPSAGAPFSLDLDALGNSSTAGFGEAIQLIVKQAGTTYAMSIGTTPVPPFAWTALTFTGIFDPDAFTRVIGAGPLNPVFDGATTTAFGVGVGNSGAKGTVDVNYDNFALLFAAAAPAPATALSSTQISIAACNQDLTQRAQPFITKYTYTFWNEDEFSRTGTHECGDSYYETTLPALSGNGAAPNPGPFIGMPLAQYSSLGTRTAYMRIESVADTFVCANAVQFGMLGVIARSNAGVYVRGTNLVGRGTRAGVMTYDPGPADSFKR